ncbi:MAG: MgtC/SapB family protein [Parcubacteria group bacterium]
MEWWRPDVVFPVLGALGAGAAVGLERELRGQPAGLRTHILVSLAACFLMLMAVRQELWAAAIPHDTLRIDPVRMAHGILTGVGFLCGGVIFRTTTSVHGLTTAASLWITSALGMMFGVQLYWLALGATVLVVIVLSALRFFDDLIPQEVLSQLVVRFDRPTAPTTHEFRTELGELGLRSSIFTHKMTEHGALIEISAAVRGRNRATMDRLLEVLRDDARVKEFELYPRKA